MDREEAQYILQLCRPDNSEDRNDPLIAEALELLNQDAELRAWFEEQQALDTKISAEFNRVEPPADLKAAILAGMRAHAVQSQLLIGNKAEGAEQRPPHHPFSAARESLQPARWVPAMDGNCRNLCHRRNRPRGASQ